MEFSPSSSAILTMGVFRYPDDTALWSISGRVPGGEISTRHSRCSLQVPDESATWQDDFHGESKAWRALLDRVCNDWIYDWGSPVITRPYR